MYAITINLNAIERFKLKSMDNVYDFLTSFDLEVLMISAERTENSKNIHYHVAVQEIPEGISKLLWTSKIYNEFVKDDKGYIDYIAKDGNYKLYNKYVMPVIHSNRTEIELLLDDIYNHDKSVDYIRMKYPKLFLKHYNTILKMLLSKPI